MPPSPSHWHVLFHFEPLVGEKLLEVEMGIVSPGRQVNGDSLGELLFRTGGLLSQQMSEMAVLSQNAPCTRDLKPLRSCAVRLQLVLPYQLRTEGSLT